MGIFLDRIVLSCINIFLPPLSVMLVAGVGPDALINTLFFLAGVIPGHIHGFYITWTYFSRRRKVAKGGYPGGPKPLIFSRRVINGDASPETVAQLWRAEQQEKEQQLARRRSRRPGHGKGRKTTSRRP